MNDVKEKKRKLQLNRETLMPLQRDALGTVVGGDNRDTRDRTQESIVFSGAASGAASLVTSAASAGVSAAASASASAVGASIDRVSEKLGLPCWTVTTASVISRFTRR